MNNLVVYPLLAPSAAETFTATGTGAWQAINRVYKSVSANLSNTTTPAATIEIHCTNDPTETPSASSLVATLTMSGAVDTAKMQITNAFVYICAKCTAISGTSATVAVKVGA